MAADGTLGALFMSCLFLGLVFVLTFNVQATYCQVCVTLECQNKILHLGYTLLSIREEFLIYIWKFMGSYIVYVIILSAQLCFDMILEAICFYIVGLWLHMVRTSSICLIAMRLV